MTEPASPTLTREAAWTLLTEFTSSPVLIRHALAVEAAILSTASQYGEEELTSVEGRTRVAAALRDAMNDVLIRNEDFGGIEEVMFTAFVFQ